jgi:alpha-ribazole phosphatase
MEIILVRHGFSIGNLNHTLSGWTDVALTEQGIEELYKFKSTKEYDETALYFSSDLKRAYDTARILFPDKTIQKRKEFREINFGIYENKNPLQLNFREFFQRWFKGDKIEDGENYFEFMDRIVESFYDLNQEVKSLGHNSYTLISHSGVIRGILSHLEDASPRDFFEYDAPNGLGYKLELEEKNSKYIIREIEKI